MHNEMTLLALLAAVSQLQRACAGVRCAGLLAECAGLVVIPLMCLMLCQELFVERVHAPHKPVDAHSSACNVARLPNINKFRRAFPAQSYDDNSPCTISGAEHICHCAGSFCAPSQKTNALLQGCYQKKVQAQMQKDRERERERERT
jgi:hypothetical protein